MSGTTLDLARSRALALSALPASRPIDRSTADRSIKEAIRTRGGSRACTLAIAEEYGEHPELIAARLRWAIATVSTLYPTRRFSAVPHLRALPGQVERPRPGGGPVDRFAAA